MLPGALVFGWYGHGNAGDEFFRDAFRVLIPDTDLSFVDRVLVGDLIGRTCFVMGGGSFLYKEPRFGPGVVEALKSIPYAYVGVGAEGDIHAEHIALMKGAKLVVVRSVFARDSLRERGVDATFMPDIVRALPHSSKPRRSKDMLIVTNHETVPNWTAPSWSLLAWERYKNEMAQFLDERLEAGWKLSFLSMCKNSRMDDLWPATEIASKMVRRSTNFRMVQGSAMPYGEIMAEFEGRSVVISQRYHGLILAENARIPSVSLHHHDKLRFVEPFGGTRAPYYEFSKRALHSAVDEAERTSLPPSDVDFAHLKESLARFVREANDDQVRRNQGR